MTYFLIALLGMVTSIPWLLSKRRNRRIKRWRKSFKLDKHLPVFNQLYASANGFQLSRHARQHNDAPEYVYGEIDFESFIALLSLCKPNADSIFYDLGSGTGKAVIACAMVFEIRKSCGIELFTGLYQCAKARQQQLMSLPEYAEKARKIYFKPGDFRQISFADANILFINASAFFGELWLEISRHVEQLKPGSQVMTTSKALVSNRYKTRHITTVKMSWGVVTAYIQERLPDETLGSRNKIINSP